MNISDIDISVLKALVTNKTYALEFINEYDAKLFSPEYWNFANVVITCIRKYKEVPTLRILIDKVGKNEKFIDNVNKIWNQLEQADYNDKEYKHNLDNLKRRFAEKQILSVKDSLSKFEPGNDFSKMIGEMQKTIQTVKGLDSAKSYDSKNIKDHLPLFVESFNAKRENPNYEAGIKTKYSFIDYATNGLRPADFVIIAGESGFGKSLLLQNIAIQTWMQDNKIETGDFTKGHNIAYFSLEMPYADCFNRLLSRLSGVASRKIENSALSKEEFCKVKKCLDFIKEYPNVFRIIDIANASANDLETILLDCDEKFDAIFVDYLGIMKTNEDKEDQDWLKQGIISYELRAIARKYCIPMFSAVQLNRKSGKDKADVIGLSRLARSGTIATHATHVLQIESRIEESKMCDMNIHVVKNRKGPKGKFTLYKNLACATLIDKPEEEVKNNIFTEHEDILEKVGKLEL